MSCAFERNWCATLYVLCVNWPPRMHLPHSPCATRLDRLQVTEPVLRYMADTLCRRSKRGNGSKCATTCHRSGTGGPGGRMKKATIEASAPRAYFVCASCAAENLPFHDGPKKCARHDPGRNHYRRLREEMERIAERRERRLRKEANRLAKHRRLAPEQSRRCERTSEASGPTVKTTNALEKAAASQRPITSYLSGGRES